MLTTLEIVITTLVVLIIIILCLTDLGRSKGEKDEDY